MESSTHRNQSEEQRQAEIRRQIALLQAQLKENTVSPNQPGPTTPKKRKPDGHTVLAAATPSPKKRKSTKTSANVVTSGSGHNGLSTRRRGISRPEAYTKHPTARPKTQVVPSNAKPSASVVLSKLATFATPTPDDDTKTGVNRSSAFGQTAVPPPPKDITGVHSVQRDNDLAIIEELELGPYEHKPPFDDPHFEKLEPNSGIRLSSRSIPHADFQDYLRGRYYLSPSKLYSVIRLSTSKQNYDVPVEGDWVTIAVVAERGPLRYTKAPVGIGKEEQKDLSDEEDNVRSLSLDQPPKPVNPNRQFVNQRKGKGNQDEPQKPSGKKYVNLKLIDFGCRTRSSASGGKAAIRGDAFLSLLLFEADRVDVIERDDGVKEKIYKGGSRGAFERLSKLKEGAVVAFLNPRILKPFQRSGDAPHPTENILAITPESADAIVVIGQSRDLGMCTATKRDGKRCGAWCDKRVSDVCDYHIQHAVQGKRAGRAEFTAGTSGMTSAAKRKPDYAPARQWGLKPETDRSEGTGATYVVSGHVLSGGTGSLFLTESLGRDAQAKAARKVAARDADLALQKLLRKDKEGARAVKAARDFGRTLEKKAQNEKAGSSREKGKGKELQTSGESEDENEAPGRPAKNAYSASLIKNLGFDPTAKDGRRAKDEDVEKKLGVLANLQASRKVIALGPRPGKLKSTVWVPDSVPDAKGPDTRPSSSRHSCVGSDRSESPPLIIPGSDDGPDEELLLSAPVRQIGQGGKTVRPNPTNPDRVGPVGMVDLDSSDVDY